MQKLRYTLLTQYSIDEKTSCDILKKELVKWLYHFKKHKIDKETCTTSWVLFHMFWDVY